MGTVVAAAAGRLPVVQFDRHPALAGQRAVELDELGDVVLIAGRSSAKVGKDLCGQAQVPGRDLVGVGIT
jgi:hypothetical protein